jgi:hypothetical protein
MKTPPCPACWRQAEQAIAREVERAVNRHTVCAHCGPAGHPDVYPIAASELEKVLGLDADYTTEDTTEVWIAETGFLPPDLVPGHIVAGICDRCGTTVVLMSLRARKNALEELVRSLHAQARRDGTKADVKALSKALRKVKKKLARERTSP